MAQTDSLYDQIENDIEQSILNGSVIQATDTYERAAELEALGMNPLNVNTADWQTLILVPVISLQLARNIIRYRQENGPFERIKDLLKVRGIGTVTLNRMKPYIRAGGMAMYNRSKYWSGNGKMTATLRYLRPFQEAAGYVENGSGKRYAGPPSSIGYRLHYRSRHLDIGWQQARDAGEKMDGKLGFDFSSFHLAIRKAGLLRSLIAGDYKVTEGQGLVLWNGYSFGNGFGMEDRSMKDGDVLKSSNSGDENRFFRGAGITFGNKLRITGFWSDRNWSARTAGPDTVHMPDMSGLYRTANERSRRYNTGFTVIGGRLSWNSALFEIGINGYEALFGKYLLRGKRIYQQDDFEGRRASAFSMDYRWSWHNMMLFGEAAVSRNHAGADLAGLGYDFGSHAHAVFIYRNFARAYHSIFGNAQSEQGGPPQNERGWYMALNYKPGRVNMGGYVDLFSFPGPSFYSIQPAGGTDGGLFLQIRMNDKSEFEFRARTDQKIIDANEINSEGRLATVQEHDNRDRISVLIKISNGRITARTEAGVTRTGHLPGNWNYGMRLSQGIRWNLTGWLRFDGNILLFDTDNYDARVYQYEFNLPNSFSIPSFYGRGQRTYFMIRISTGQHIEWWVRYGVTVYNNRFSIGTGLDEIQGDRKSSLGIVVRLRF